jgi:endonuclease YncB( thermonuclease family)
MKLRDKDARLTALERLAVATREKVEPQTFALYLEDTALIPTDTLVAACRRLERSMTWFPKLKEILDGCALVVADQQAQQVVHRLQPHDAPDPERLQMWMEKIKAACQGKRMPS